MGNETLTQFETIPTGTYEAVTAIGGHVIVEKRSVASFGIRWQPLVEAHSLHLPMPPESAREIAPHLRGYMVADLQAPLTVDTVDATASTATSPFDITHSKQRVTMTAIRFVVLDDRDGTILLDRTAKPCPKYEKPTVTIAECLY